MSYAPPEEWDRTKCEEIYFITFPGKWNNMLKRIWETPNSKLYLIDKHNFATDMVTEKNISPDSETGGTKRLNDVEDHQIDEDQVDLKKRRIESV
jgi:hypothetical protein